jgi:hypothetical protein
LRQGTMVCAFLETKPTPGSRFLGTTPASASGFLRTKTQVGFSRIWNPTYIFYY